MMSEAAVAISKPNFSAFIPFGYQIDVLKFLYSYQYEIGTPEILLSGSVGSAKSILMAHIAIRHCLENVNACVAIGRRSLPDLKKTLFREIIEHLQESLIEGYHFTVRNHTGEIEFCNGARIISVTWGDQRWAKFRSLKLSGLMIEELTENDDDFEPGFKILKARLRRIPGIRHNFLITATNPGEPDSYWHKYFIEGSKTSPTRFVFYSVTTDNFYLDAVYIEQLLRDYSVLEAERYLKGKWISIGGEGIYHAYAEERNLIGRPFVPDKTKPLRLTFDFNVADGKPQSCALFQYVRGEWHFFGESVIKDANWCLDNLDDFEANGLLGWKDTDGSVMRFPKYLIYGDATGRSKSANSLYSNYELIEGWFKQRRLICSIEVPRANPPLVTRWTTVNAMCQNAMKEVRLYVHESCPTLNQGMKLARKKEGTALEDDSKAYQHITTALGYAVWYIKNFDDATEPRVTHL